jgi:predicted house-cleaning noncanonical NTP pyrophosphatase (MazG superfamily)
MKLVRDKYKDIIPEDKLFYIEQTDKKSLIKYLSLKLKEETQEFIDTGLTSLEELADIMEVLDTIMETFGINPDELANVAKNKNEEKGSFKDYLLYDDSVPEEAKNNGGSTDYYKLPAGAKDLQDLIEFKNMNFSQGNIFKAMYRSGVEHHSTYERDLNKIIFFAKRELNRIKGDS